ncbi:MAG: hypothetical protein GEU73_12925 [Chloroflexi bacterium]|nr:hypothetical protein [Chloroflexota bacterium]
MKQLTVRDVPEAVVRVLREEAKERGQSVNSVARSALSEHATRHRWRRQLADHILAMDALRARIARRREGDLEESAPLIREDRER